MPAAAKPSETVRVIVIYPGAEPEVRTLPNTLEAFQGIVGGFIEVARVAPAVHLIWNEDGRSQKLPPNRLVGDAMILGPIVVARHNSAGDNVDLTDDDVRRFTQEFRL